MINFTEKLCICYTCCGPTYRKSALDRLTNVYFSHPNLYYSVLTDDKTYFKDLKMDNLVIHELKDYYKDFPDLEKNEAFMESTSEADYGQKFYDKEFRFPYSTYRFHLLEAEKFGVCNVAFLSTDIKLHMNFITDELFEDKNSCVALVGWHPTSPTEERINHITEIIKRKYNITPHDEIFIFDGAARFFVFQDVEFMRKFFNMWNDVVNTLYAENKIYISFGTYVVHDEFILAPIFDVLGIHPPKKDVNVWALYYCYEIAKIERFWTFPKMTDYPGKFVMAMTGPLMKYRLEILLNACPRVKDYLLILTDRHSYYLYDGYHNLFDFVIMDDYRKEYPISLKYEILPPFDSESEYFSQITKFYGMESGNFYPYDISRFIFPHFLEHGLLNFMIICTDTILVNDIDLYNKVFHGIPSGTICGQWMGEDTSHLTDKLDFWKNEMQPLFPQIKLEAPNMIWNDGFLRGFHFRNKEEMKLFFDLWNTSIERIHENREWYDKLNSNSSVIFGSEWIFSHIGQFFQHQLGYQFVDFHQFTEIDGRKVLMHCSRPEDTFYVRSWDQFDYSDKSSISGFIKNNKEELVKYYLGRFPICEATDNFIYTRLT